MKSKMLLFIVTSILAVADVLAGVREDVEAWKRSNVSTLQNRISGHGWQELPDVEDNLDMRVISQKLFGKSFKGSLEGQMNMLIDSPKAKLALWRWRDENAVEHEFSVWKTAKIERQLHFAAIGIDGRGRNVASYVVDELGLADREYILKGFADERRVSTFSVQGKFSGETYKSPFSDGWFCFVDDQPYANWSHPCRYVFVSGDMSAYVIIYSNEPVSVFEDGVKVELDQIGGNKRKATTGSTLDQVRSAINAMNANSINFDGDTSHSYAIVISGGGDKDTNYSRYWGDVAMIYSTLRLKYAIPKNHIKVCVSDGTSTTYDMLDTGTKAYKDSPKDLDGDGVADIEYDAKKATIKSVFQNLSANLTADDQLFVFITDHGAQDQSTGISYLVPWLDGSTGVSAHISPTELSSWLAAFRCPVAVAMEYCYSGPFINPIVQTSNRAVGTACGNEPSSAFCWSDPTGRLSASIVSDAFDYCNPYAWAFNSAIRGADSVWACPWRDDSASQVGNADTDGDGRVSFYEAAQCARSFVLNTTKTYEGTLMTFCDSPQYGESSSGFGASFFMVKNGVTRPTIPGAPTASISGATLSWNAVNGANYYKVYRSTNPYAEPTALSGWQSSRSYTVSAPSSYGSHFYFVKASSNGDDETAGPFSSPVGKAYGSYAEIHKYASSSFSVMPVANDSTPLFNMTFYKLSGSSSDIVGKINNTTIASGYPTEGSSGSSQLIIQRNTFTVTGSSNTSASPRFWGFYTTFENPPTGSWFSTGGKSYAEAVWLAHPHYYYQSGVASFSIGSTSKSVEKSGGTYSVTVSATPSTTSWSASTSADWITLYRTSSSGSGVLGYIVAENAAGGQRTGTITLSGASTTKTLTVTQAGPVAAVSLSSISISGYSTVTSGGNATYTCTATMSDGTTKTVTPTWSIYSGSSYASISTSGKLTANTVTSSQNVTVKASYTEGGVTKTATKSVAIDPPAVSLSSISITGPDCVFAGKTGSFVASAKMSDGTTTSITPAWSIYSGSSYASISTAGVLTGKTVTSPQSVTVKASYTKGGVTKTATKTVTVYQTFALTAALDNSMLTFTTGGSADWFGQGKTTYDGTDAARSGIITHNQNSWMQTTVTGPGTFSFRWYASSEIGTSSWYDYLTFSIDGVQKDKIGGTSCSWTQCSYTLGAGSHTLKWDYLKDGSQDKGEDAGFVDQVVWTPIVAPSAPTGVSATDGTYSDKVVVSWTGSSGATSYNLYRSTTSTRPSTATKTGVTSPYSDTSATPGAKYYYWVSAVNSAGSNYSTSDTGYRAVSLALGKTEDSYAAAGGNGSASVTANTSWSATTDVSWITLGTSSGSGNGTLTYTVAANTSSESRTGMITVTAGVGTTYPATKSISVTQEGVSDFVVVDGVLTKYIGAGGAVTIPPGVTSIGEFAFEYCTGLTSVTIPSSVTSIGGAAFAGCSGLASISVDSANRCFCSIEGVLYDKDATVLICCPGAARSITIPSSVTSIDNGAFAYCEGLASVTIPSSVTSIGVLAFEYCTGLTSVTIPSGVTSVDGSAFVGCGGLASINVDSANRYFRSVEGVLYDKDATVLICCPGAARSITIPSSVTSIADMAFSHCEGLTSVTMPSSVTSIGFFAFEHCTGLTSVTIPSSVTSIGFFAFSLCDALSAVYVSDGDSQRVSELMAESVFDVSGVTFIEPEQSQVGKPVISPADGSTFDTDGCTVTITCATEGAEIYYSTNGRTPRTTEANRYKGAFTITDTATIVAVAVKGEKTSEYVEATITKVIPEPLTLVGVLDEPKLTSVTTGGDAEWLPMKDATAKIGGSCAVSGALDESDEGLRETWLEAKVYGKGTLTFWWRVSCEPDPRAGKFTYDFAAFEADDEVVVKKDGESDWMQVTKTFTTDGEHVIRWSYNTDGWPCDDYDGCVWVDGVTWSGSVAPEESPKPTVEGDEGATVTGDAETGFVVKPSEGKTMVEVTIPQGVDAAKVTVEVSPKVASVKLNGAKVKIVSGGVDITELLNVPLADRSGVVDLTKATVKEEYVKEALDPKEGAVIDLCGGLQGAANPTITTAPTRTGLFYQLREGTTLDGMKDGDSTVGNGQPWSPKITVKGGNSAFYSIGVGKGK